MESTKTVRISDFVNSKDPNELGFHSFDIEDVSMDGTSFMSKNLIRDYLDDLDDLYYTLYFSEDELFKYKYRPRLLAHKLYGNPNYYYMILLVNNMCDEKQFDRKAINILKPADMFNVISAIYNSNTELIKFHRIKANKAKKQV